MLKEGWGCSSVVEGLPHVWGPSIPSKQSKSDGSSYGRVYKSAPQEPGKCHRDTYGPKL